MAMAISKNGTWLWIIVLTLVCASCNKAPDRPKVTQVSGQVFVENKPAKGALITLVPMQAPEDVAKSWKFGYPRATVGADGKFQVSTYELGDGAPPGEYRLTIIWPVMEMVEGPDGELVEGEKPVFPPQNRINTKYSEPGQTPLNIKVEEKPLEIPKYEL
ncbi:MAG: hypothetical protein ACO1RA_18410 [Planctomycetaceae bacterium]